MTKQLLLFLLGTALLLPAHAQHSGPIGIVTDRPSQSSAGYVLPVGVVQLENGTQAYSGLYLADYSNTLWGRLGLGWAELRLGLSGTTITNPDRLYATGLSVGTKVRLIEQSKLRMAALSSVDFVTLHILDSNNVRLGLSLVLATDIALSDQGVLTTNLGAWDGAFYRLNGSLLYTHYITPQLAVFGELFSGGWIIGTTTLAWDAGLVYQLSPAFQLDLSGGHSLHGNNAFTPNQAFIELGISGLLDLGW